MKIRKGAEKFIDWKVHIITSYVLLMTFLLIDSKHCNTDGKKKSRVQILYYLLILLIKLINLKYEHKFLYSAEDPVSLF